MFSTVLAFDTSTSLCSVAVFVEQTIYQQVQVAQHNHSRLLLPMIDAVLSEAKLSLEDIQGIAYGQGPGSFTGVRIAASTAQGLAFGRQLPTLGCSSLSMLAYPVLQARSDIMHIFCALDARMNEVYFAHFECHGDRIHLIGEERLMTPSAVQTYIAQYANQASVCVGEGFQAYPNIIQSDLIVTELMDQDLNLPQASSILAMLQTANPEQWLAAHLIKPMYLRNSVIQSSSK
jgi:tRNA threonylcarbamoyladenosine biosynthesis protein TsaB